MRVFQALKRRVLGGSLLPRRGVCTEISSIPLYVSALVLLGAPCFAQSISPTILPTNPQVTVGAAQITSTQNVLTVQQNTTKTAINWDSFSVGENAKVKFKQPDANSIALNRVVGNEQSIINGAVEANGQIFILNTNGVLTGKNARITAAGIVLGATTLSDADFQTGKTTLERNANSGDVINQGTITATDGGYAVLVGKNVSNQGIITARLGTVALAAGDKVMLKFAGASLLDVTVDKATLDAYVENKQAIYADGGVVLLTAKAKNALLATVVNNDGVIEAKSISNKNGVIRLEGSSEDGTALTQVSGVLDASGLATGEKGGEIAALGDRVQIKDTTVLNASGDNGGGKINVGGDYQGNNPTQYKNAKRTQVTKTAQLKADAVKKGNGGRIIIWADDATDYRGTTTVRGGAQGGDGGFVEVSGKKYLSYKGTVDTTAAQGKTGLLLLDPTDIVILNGSGDGAADGNTNFMGAATSGTVAGGDSLSTIYESELQGITATTNISLTATNSITINSLTTDGVLNLAQTAGRTVSFTTGAGGFIMANTANTIQTAGGALTIITTGGTSSLGNLATAGGLITLNIGGTATVSGVISGTNTALTKTGTGTVTLAGLNTYTGATTINAGILSVGTLANGGTASGIGQSANTAGNLVLGGGTLQYTGATVSTNRAYTLTAATTNTIDIVSGAATLTISGAAATTTGALTKTGSGGLTLSGANAYTGLTTVSAGTLNYGVNNALSSGAVTVNGGTLNLATFTDTVGTVTLIDGTITGSTGVLTGTSYAVQNGTINGILGGAVALTKTTAGTVVISSVNSYTGLTTVSAGTLRYGITNALSSGAVTVNGGTLDLVNFTDTVGAVTLTSGTITSTSGVLTGTSYAVQSGTISGILGGAVALTKTTAGTVILSSVNSYTGLTTVSAGTLQYGVNNALSTGGVTLNGGTLDLLSFSDSVGAVTLTSGIITGTTGVLTGSSYAVSAGTISGILGGAGAMTKSTAGLVTLTGANTFSGGTTISGGTLRAEGNASALGTGNVSVGAGVLQLAGDTPLVFNNNTIITGGTGNAIVVDRVTSGAGVTHTLGTLSIGNVTSTVSLGSNVTSGTAGLIFGNTTLTAATSIFQVFTGVDVTLGALSNQSANRSLTKTGTGTLILGQAATAAWGTATNTITVNNGTLRMGANNAFGTGTNSNITINANATGATATLDLDTYTLNTGTITFGGTGGTTTSTNRITGTTGILNLGGAVTVTTTGNPLGATWSGNLNLGSSARTFTVNDSTTATDDLTISAVISGASAASLTKTGAGRLALTGLNTYTGATFFNGGVLSANTFADGGVASSFGAASAALQNLTFVNGTLLYTGASVSTNRPLTFNNSTTNTINISDSTATLNFTAVSDTRSGAIIKTGAGTLYFSAANQFTGNVTINAGVLKVDTLANGGVASGIGRSTNAATSLVFGGGTLQYTGATVTTDRAYTLTAATTSTIDIVSGAATLTISGASTATTGALTKTGSGGLTLSAANLYTGLTTIAAGTLNYGINNALSSGAVTVNGGTLNLATFNDTVGAVTLTSGIITGSTGVLTGTSYAVQDGTVSAILGGTAALTKTTTGTVTLTRANTYTGATTINAGILSVGTLANGGTASNIGQSTNAAANLVLGGGTLQYTGATASTNRNYTLTTATASTVEISNSGAVLTLSGASTATTGSLAKTGDGVLVLSGANLFSGGIDVSAGTLRLGASNVLGDGNALTIASGAVFDVNSFNETVASLNSSGTVILGTGNTFITSGNQTYTGQVTGGAITLNSTGGSIIANNTTNDFTGTVSVSSTGAVSLVDANALTLGAVTANTFAARTLTGALTTTGVVNASATTGTALELNIATNYINTAGASALQTGAGARWIVYSNSPITDARNTLVADFRQYNAPIGTTPVASGNGFLYTVAPTITVSLTGTVSRDYNGTTAFTLGASNYALTGMLGTDSVTLNNPASGDVSSANAGSSVALSVTGIVIASAVNGAETIYGYTLTSSTATANIATINKAALSISTTDVVKDFDGTVAALGNAVLVGGTLFGSDNISGGTFAFTNVNAGVGKTVTTTGVTVNDGNSGGNYQVTFVDNTTSTINPVVIPAPTTDTAIIERIVSTIIRVNTSFNISEIIIDLYPVNTIFDTSIFSQKSFYSRQFTTPVLEERKDSNT